MRVVGYVREAPDPREGEPAFAQSERIRRWATDGGHTLIAVCQDLRSAGTGERRGLRAVMDVLQGGTATAVVVPDLSVLSPDKVIQEIILRDLRGRGAVVISTDEADQSHLDPTTGDRLRRVVRDVLIRLDEHEAQFPVEHAEPSSDDAATEVIVELVGSDHPGAEGRIRPVR